MTKQWKPLVDYERIDLALAGTWLGIREGGSVIGLGVGDSLVKAKLPPTLRFCVLVEVDDPTPTIPPEIAETLLEAIENHRRLWNITHGFPPDDVRDRAIAALEWIKGLLPEDTP